MNIKETPVWGKTNPYESVFSHSDKVAICMEVLSEHMKEKFEVASEKLGISYDEAVRLSCYLAGVHDLGKIVPTWQGQPAQPQESRGFFDKNEGLIRKIDLGIMGYRHERGSREIIKRIWKENGMFTPRIRTNLSAILLVHHQKINAKFVVVAGLVRDSGITCPNEWFQWQEELELYYRNKYSIENIHLTEESDNEPINFDVACMVMSGLLIFADWMGSSLSAEPYKTSNDRKAYKKKVDSLVSEMGFSGKDNIPTDFKEMWPWIENPRPLQKTAIELMKKTTPLLTIIEDVMGAGKTEAGIYIAEVIKNRLNKNGLYIALPTSATANQMHERFDELLSRFGQKDSRLLHGTAWLQTKTDDDEISLAETFLEPAKMGLFSPNGVGTIDQVLMSILKNKFGNLRLTGIADKVLLIDEVHAYDTYMTKELLTLLHWCKAMGVPVIMMSATLPNKKRAEFVSIYSDDEIANIGYPRITTVDMDGKLNETIVKNTFSGNTYHIAFHKIYNDTDAIVTLALERLKNGGCLCINVNTVSRAIEISETLSKATDDVYIFHSRYTMERRAEIEKECISLFGKNGKRPKRAILVATQVVEQSLDIDFDFYITDICPIDLILQRIGREFRHKRKERPCEFPQVDILIPQNTDYKSTALIYMPYLLDRTSSLLSNRETISTPNDIQDLVDYVYKHDDEIEEELVKFNPAKIYEEKAKMDMQNAVASEYAYTSVLNEPGTKFQFGKILSEGGLDDINAKTRLGRPSVRAAVLPTKLYQKILNGTATRKEEEQAYKYTFTMNYDQWKYPNTPKGQHMFSDTYILEGKESEFSPTEDIHAANNTLWVSCKYGVILKE